MTKILLYKAGKDVIGRLIAYFTESSWGHVAICVGGNTYEETWPGVKKTAGQNAADLVLIPPALDEEKVLAYLEKSVTAKLRYNWMRLCAFIFIYPLRWFFSRLGWVPFSVYSFGEVCSSFVDEAVRAGGIDLWPHRGEDSTVPADYLWCPALEGEE